MKPFLLKFRTCGLGRQIGQINYGAFGGTLSWAVIVSFWYSEFLCFMFFIIQSLLLQKTKPLYPHPNYSYGIGIWIWAEKNLEFSLRVSVVCDCVGKLNLAYTRQQVCTITFWTSAKIEAQYCRVSKRAKKAISEIYNSVQIRLQGVSYVSERY